ncbi:Pycsar system effector family protein [Ensifer aridi]|uniref:Pycsar system effector family protein n=1 Tax=Ensifer aridi TaxID=1708715 RepID=UPI00358ED03A
MDSAGSLYKLDTSSEERAREVASSAYFDHVQKINEVFSDQIKMSDQKAAYIFTFMFAFLVSSEEGRAVFTWQRYMEGSMLPMILSAIMAMASIFSLLCAILVVLPRKGATSTTLFWGAWRAHRDEFLEAAGRDDSSYLFRQYIDNADVLSSIACSKYRFVILAFRGLLVTVLSYVMLLAAAPAT